MKLPATFTLNGATIAVVLDVEIPEAAPAVFLNDADLRARWHCAARSTYRVRQTRRLAFTQPTPGKYLYRLSDVEAFEAASRTEARPLVRVARRTA